MEERTGDYMVSDLLWVEGSSVREKVDALLIYLSIPDERGYCSFEVCL